MKLLLLDEESRVLLVHAKDPATGNESWYPVGGGVESGETLQQAAAREAYEETGLEVLPAGTHVWFRDHTYRFDGRVVEVHEDWWHHSVRHFDPVPAGLTRSESRSVVGFRWWSAGELMSTTDAVFPPRLGGLLMTLLRDGAPVIPIDITTSSLAANDPNS